MLFSGTLNHIPEDLLDENGNTNIENTQEVPDYPPQQCDPSPSSSLKVSKKSAMSLDKVSDLHKKFFSKK